MSHRMLLRSLVLLASATATARATEEFGLQYTIQRGAKFWPIDVAVYAPLDSKVDHGLFLVDAAANQLLRYKLNSDGSLASSVPDIWFDDPSRNLVVSAVAVDDNPDSPNFGLVHRSFYDSGLDEYVVLSSDKPGFSGQCSVRAPGFKKIVALAVDKHGDLYVADAGAGRTERYGSGSFTFGNVCTVIAPDATIAGFSSAPADVTVTESDLVLVVDSCGCMMASNRDGTDFWDRNAGVPKVSLSIDAHCESERVWTVDLPGSSTSTQAERLFFSDCYKQSFPPGHDGVTATYSGGTLTSPVRAEYARFWDIAPMFGPLPRCSERLFVTDPGANRVVCFGRSQTVTQWFGNPAALWRFDETSGNTVYDATGKGNDGTFGWSTPPRREEGMVKRGLVFTDADDGVSVASAAALNVGTGSFTMECWVRSCDKRGVRDILDKRLMNGTAAVRGYELYLYNGYLSFQIAANSRWWNVGTASDPAGQVADGKFHHVAVVVDHDAGSVNQDTVAFYVDGAQVGSNQAIPSNVIGNLTNALPLLIGRHPGWGDNGITGEIDEIGIYKRTLEPATILAIANAVGAGKYY